MTPLCVSQEEDAGPAYSSHCLSTPPCTPSLCVCWNHDISVRSAPEGSGALLVISSKRAEKKRERNDGWPRRNRRSQDRRAQLTGSTDRRQPNPPPPSNNPLPHSTPLLPHTHERFPSCTCSHSHTRTPDGCQLPRLTERTAVCGVGLPRAEPEGGGPVTMDLKESCESEASGGSLQPSSWQVFAHQTTLHGLRFIFALGPLTVRRLFWAAAFLASLGFLALESAERLAYFFSYPHVTRVDAVVSNSLVFPVVTICNLNPYRFTKLTRNDLYHAGELLALLDVHLRIQDPHLAEPEVLNFLAERANFTGYKPKPFSMKEFTERVGHDLKDMMLYCRFRGQECSHHDFKSVSPLPLPVVCPAGSLSQGAS
ncbi:hypothetical protein MATL_G00012300 [Megalops atlanticus]|uniref:Acid-sensing ion channel 2 n=1 Tax=Megalops atlanticus TaxID=7932 RepID=A0A9D3QLB7_MEGAT|nr:hypothetical protein MATL_G00012300 [Megalops atlanticus]